MLPGSAELSGNRFVRRRADSGLGHDDGYKAPLLPAILKFDYARNLREEGIVFATTDIQARLERCAALPNQNGATGDGFRPRSA